MKRYGLPKCVRVPGINFCLLVLLMMVHVHGQANETPVLLAQSPEALKQLSLEELMDIPVTTVARKQQKLSDTASAIDVITNERIRRSGARSLPDILRLATGLHVAQFDGRSWGVSARGFNNVAANKMLVLMDGRTLYSPHFSGTHWNVQNYPIEDIERIEVIRGPGATMWGANAVNGVINIITKSARDTQGGLLSLGGGTYEQGFGTMRYGGKIGEDTFYRAYVTGFNRDDTKSPSGQDRENDWYRAQAGFRVDSDLDEDNRITVQGDLYYNQEGLTNSGDVTDYGANLLSRWTHTFSDESDMLLQVYYDRTGQAVPFQPEDDLDTFDIDFQHRFPVGTWNDIVWGLSYRFMRDRVVNAEAWGLIPPDREIHLFTGFIQDEIDLIEDELSLILGSKFEHNDFTGFEIQPSARIAWTPTEWQTLWGSISRAVRTPTRFDEELYLNDVVNNIRPSFLGTGGFESEELLAFEIGYRIRPFEPLYIEIATFYNDYDSLRSFEPSNPYPILLKNMQDAETYGVELEVNYQFTPWWRSSGSYTYMQLDFHYESGSMAFFPPGTLEANDPQHMFKIHNSFDIARNLYFDWIIRYVDELPNPYIPDYLVMDARLAWYPKENLQLELVARNFLDDHHPELNPGHEVQHSAFASLTWWF